MNNQHTGSTSTSTSTTDFLSSLNSFKLGQNSPMSPRSPHSPRSPTTAKGKGKGKGVSVSRSLSPRALEVIRRKTLFERRRKRNLTPRKERRSSGAPVLFGFGVERRRTTPLVRRRRNLTLKPLKNDCSRDSPPKLSNNMTNPIKKLKPAKKKKKKNWNQKKNWNKKKNKLFKNVTAVETGRRYSVSPKNVNSPSFVTEKLKSEIVQKNEEIQKLVNYGLLQKNQVREKEEMIETLEESLEKKERVCGELEEKCKSLSYARQVLGENLREIKESVVDLKWEIENLERKNLKFDDLKRDNQRLVENNSKLRKSMNKLKSQQNSKFENLKKNNQRLVENNTKVRKTVNELKFRLSDKKKKSQFKKWENKNLRRHSGNPSPKRRQRVKSVNGPVADNILRGKFFDNAQPKSVKKQDLNGFTFGTTHGSNTPTVVRKSPQFRNVLKESQKVTRRVQRKLSVVKGNYMKMQNEKEKEFILFKMRVTKLMQEKERLKQELKNQKHVSAFFGKRARLLLETTDQMKQEISKFRSLIISKCNFMNLKFSDAGKVVKEIHDKKSETERNKLEMLRAKVQLETLLTFGVVLEKGKDKEGGKSDIAHAEEEDIDVDNAETEAS